MIQNQAQPEVAEKLSAEAAANSLVAATTAAAEASADPFEVETSGAGLEILARAPLPNGIPNRARMKIFSPKAGHTLVFFYKKSLFLTAVTVTAMVGLTCARRAWNRRKCRHGSPSSPRVSTPTSARRNSAGRFLTKSRIKKPGSGILSF